MVSSKCNFRDLILFFKKHWSQPSKKLTFSWGVLTYGKDAYITPIVMLRRPKNRYCQFFGINVSSAQIFIDAYRIWPIMMP